MWEARAREIASGVQFQILQRHSPLSFRELFNLLENSSDFARWYSETLADTTLPAFFWENPPLTTKTLDRDAEFVLIEAASLSELRPEPEPFESHFAGQPDTDVIAFSNLSGDALLIVPRPIGPVDIYPHQARYLRQASESQIRSLWQAAAKAVRENLSLNPLWLSTAGLGVSWLHLRLDTWPKYSRFGPYKGRRVRPTRTVVEF